MIRLRSLLVSAALVMGGALLGCGGGGETMKTALEVVPRSGEISGWTVDPSNLKTADVAAQTATTELATEGLIDGAAADFFAPPNAPKTFAWQNYVSSTVTDAPEGASVTLYILEMPSAAEAAGLYASLRSASLYTRKVGTPDDWKDPSDPRVGDGSRIQNTGDTWWINFHKANLYVEVSLNPSQGPAPDFTPGDAATKAEAFRFAQAIAAKI